MALYRHLPRALPRLSPVTLHCRYGGQRQAPLATVANRESVPILIARGQTRCGVALRPTLAKRRFSSTACLSKTSKALVEVRSHTTKSHLRSARLRPRPPEAQTNHTHPPPPL